MDGPPFLPNCHFLPANRSRSLNTRPVGPYAQLPELQLSARCSVPERSTLGLTSSAPPSLPVVSQRIHNLTTHKLHDTDRRFALSPNQRQQQQQQTQAYTEPHHFSQSSSSYGSGSHPSQWTRQFEDPLQPRPASLYPAQRQTSPEDFRANHPALRISRRTASAIRFALEEAIRKPYPFTPDLDEENSSMSELSGDMSGHARAANGGSRAASGPVPVSQPLPSGMRTPRDIMNQRHAREAKKREAEAAAAQGQRDAQAEERRRSLERRAAAAGVGGSTYRRTEPGGAGAGDISYTGHVFVGGGETQGTAATARIDPSVGPRIVDPSVDTRRPPDRPPDIISAGQADPASLSVGGATRTRAGTIPPHAHSGLAVSQQTAATYAAHTTQQPSTHRAKQATSTDPTTQAQGGPSAAPPAAQPHGVGQAAGRTTARNSGVSFPHAFERWETLSSHWEGLTSYWIRKLEQNAEELRRDPLSSQMSRQITDLSAAGANLFHAVVELQRLRASSERKFQRWFFETRTENERAQEIQGELEKALRLERQARQEDQRQAAVAIQERNNAERLLAEMGRELQISKEEARRAWEELGRREQEERDRTLSLREGQPTLVGGVQVVPMAGGGSRHGSVRDRPPTREGPAISMSGYSGVPVHVRQERGTRSPVQSEQSDEYDPEAHSPTDTDPFTEQGRRAGQIPPLHHEPGLQTLVAGTHQPYPLGSAPATSGSTARTAILADPAAPSASSPNFPPQPSPSMPIAHDAPTASSRDPFYRHGGTFLHSDFSPQVPQPAHVRSRRGTNPSEADDGSYVPSLEDPFSEEGDDEYEIDEHGHIRRDERGYPIPYGRGPQSDLQRSDTNESDESDVREALERERAHAQRYGSGAQGRSQPTSPQVGAGLVPTTASAPGVYRQGNVQAPDYSGAGYGGWEGVQRHHHPTRLSDVLEEDERSRTSASRASESRGAF